MTTTVHDIARYIGRDMARSPLQDRAVLRDLIQESDRGYDFVESDNNYGWWWWLGFHHNPKTILEIGVRFGYSLWAVTQGTRQNPAEMKFHLYDAELDADVEPLKVCEKWFHSHGYRNLTINRVNTRTLTQLEVPELVDFASVDGDHSEAGAYADCCLVWEVLRPGGLMVVDDTLPGSVRDAVERFARERNVPWGFLPSLRGIHILLKPE